MLHRDCGCAGDTAEGSTGLAACGCAGGGYEAGRQLGAACGPGSVAGPILQDPTDEGHRMNPTDDTEFWRQMQRIEESLEKYVARAEEREARASEREAEAWQDRRRTRYLTYLASLASFLMVLTALFLLVWSAVT